MTHRARMTQLTRSIKQNMRIEWGVDSPFQWGTIQAVSPGSGSTLSTVSVYLDNSSGGDGATITAAVPYLWEYSPKVGDVVLLGRMQGAARSQRFVIGPLSTSSFGFDQKGNLLGAGLGSSGVAGLNNAVAGKWIGRWSTAGAPAFTGYTPAAGDWGIDGNRLTWMYDGTEWIAQNQVIDALVATSQTTTSTSYTDLTTVGPAVTIETGTKALVSLYGYLLNSTINSRAWMGFAVSGATVVAAADNFAIEYLSSGVASAEGRIGATFLVPGLTPGSNTFTAKYKSQSGTTSTFQDRRIVVQAVGG